MKPTKIDPRAAQWYAVHIILLLFGTLQYAIAQCPPPAEQAPTTIVDILTSGPLTVGQPIYFTGARSHDNDYVAGSYTPIWDWWFYNPRSPFDPGPDAEGSNP